MNFGEVSVANRASTNSEGRTGWFSTEFSQPLISQTMALRSSLFFERQSLQDVFRPARPSG